MTAAHDSALFELEGEEDSYELVDDSRERGFGRYMLKLQIASGGMATVYLGRAMGPGGFDRPVAIKRIHPHLAKKKRFVEMFLDEARIASRINHPNVCTLLDFGEVDGTYFMAMEYLVGSTLATLLRTIAKDDARRDAPEWPAFAARIVQDAAEGLHAAHELKDENGDSLGVVHRDVSPQNLFVTYDGAVKVLDFGVALANQRMHQTTTGTLKGKLSYMAPEHARRGELDRRADVWSLGVCLWEMLTWRRLFRRDSEMATLIAITDEEIPAPSALNPRCPPELDAVVMRALERDPEARYQTTRALGRDLATFLRKQEHHVGLADLEEWAGPLFGDRKRQKEHLLKTVLFDSLSGDDDAKPAADGGRTSDPMPMTDVSGVNSRPKVQTPEALGIAIAQIPTSHPAPRAMSMETDSMPVAAPIGSIEHLVETSSPSVQLPGQSRGTLVLLATAAVAVAVLTGLIAVIVQMQAEASEPSRRFAITTAPAPQVVVPLEAPSPVGGQVSGPVPVAPTTAQVPTPPTDVTPAGPSTPATNQAPPVAGHASPTPRDSTGERARPAGIGTINIVTMGAWAEVLEGRTSLGRTPLRVRLPSGRHTLTLRALGEGPGRRVSVDLRANEVERVVVNLRE